MKKLKVKSWDNFFDLIYFEANWSQVQYIFLEIKNFETKLITLPFQRHNLELNDCLDLKQFKMGIFAKR